MIKSFMELNWTNVLKAYSLAILAISSVDFAVSVFQYGFGKSIVISVIYLFDWIFGLIPILVMVYILKVLNLDRYLYFCFIFLVLHTALDFYSFFNHLSPLEGTSTYGFSTRDCDVIVDNVRTACGYTIWAKRLTYSIFEAFIAASVFNKFYRKTGVT